MRTRSRSVPLPLFQISQILTDVLLNMSAELVGESRAKTVRRQRPPSRLPRYAATPSLT